MKILIKQIEGILEEEDLLAALSNATALIYEMVDRLNWVGYYFYKNDELVLGPFQGKVACTHIQTGKGVCGTSFEKQETIVVKNVHEFPGHIACDSASNSEIVVPLTYGDKKYGVLDIDSPFLERFGEEEEFVFKEIGKLISEKIAKSLS